MPQAFFAWLAKVAAKYAVEVIVTVALNYAIGELTRQKQERPPGFSPLRQPVPPIWRRYGHGRGRGVSLLFESVSGATLDVLAYNQGRSAGTNLRHFLHDDEVTLSGGVVQANAEDHYGADKITLDVNLGTAAQTAHENIVAKAGVLWTEDHRAANVTTVGMRCDMISQEKMQRIYPNGEPEHSVAMDWSVCYDFRLDSTSGGAGAHRRDNPATWAFTKNPVVQYVHDQLFVWGRDWERRFAPVLDILTEEADAADVGYPTTAGPEVPRYEAFIEYEGDEDMKSVTGSFIRSCDGWTTELGNGALIFRVGRWVEPEDVITGAMILDLQWSAGVPKSRLINEVQARFRNRDLGYELVDTLAWSNAVSVAARGSKPYVFDLPEVGNNSQSRRLSKIKLDQLLASHSGQWVLDLDALPASIFRHRFHRVQVANGPTSLQDVYVEFIKAEIDRIERTMTVQVRRVDPARYGWEVGEEGANPEVITPPPLPPPAEPVIYSIAAVEQPIGGAVGVRLKVVFDEALDPEVYYAARYRTAGAASYTPDGYQAPILDEARPYILTSFVPAEELEVQAAAARTGGTSDWGPEPPEEIDATVATVAPTAPTSLGATSPAAGEIAATWTNTADATYHHVRILTSAVGAAFGTAVSRATKIGVAGDPDAVTITGLATGSYDVWAVSETASSAASLTPAGPITVAVA